MKLSNKKSYLCLTAVYRFNRCIISAAVFLFEMLTDVTTSVTRKTLKIIVCYAVNNVTRKHFAYTRTHTHARIIELHTHMCELNPVTCVTL